MGSGEVLGWLHHKLERGLTGRFWQNVVDFIVSIRQIRGTELTYTERKFHH